MQDLDAHDRKLLYLLDTDSSMPLTELARRMRKSKQFVSYRMQRLEERKIITGYHAIVDMSTLGYFTFRVYLRFQHLLEAQVSEFIKHVTDELPQVWTITSMHGKWDLALFLGVQNITEFHEIWDSIMRFYKKHIASYNVAVYAPIFNFNRTFFLEHPEVTKERVYGAREEQDIDALDREIIEVWGPNVRMPLVDVANRLGVTAPTIANRIRNLEKRGIIAGYILGLNLDQLDHVGYRVDLKLSSTAQNTALHEFCKQHRNIYQINRSIGGADYEIEVIVKDLPHLITLIEEIKSAFPESVASAEYFGFSTFHILKYIPD